MTNQKKIEITVKHFCGTSQVVEIQAGTDAETAREKACNDCRRTEGFCPHVVYAINFLDTDNQAGDAETETD